jgi:hypothetical protein
MAGTAISLTDAQIDELLNQAEVRLLEKQNEPKSKGVVLPIASDNGIGHGNTTAKPSASKPATLASSSRQGQELSVRVPEARKSKKEMVCVLLYLSPHTLAMLP